jgi:nucleoside-diphosphate-sugar epimerase
MERVLVTGVSGYLGKLAAAALLAETDAELILPVRRLPVARDVEHPVLEELAALGVRVSDEHRRRMVIVPYAPDSHAALSEALAPYPAPEIIHCAGCLDYFNENELWATNVEFTRQLLEFAERTAVRRFIYISTAYSSGYIEGSVPEALHTEPERDPTIYTQTKRAAENLVAASPLATLILRPSIVIGHSRTGRYTGKQYGLYQLWSGIERLLSSTWEPDLHALAPTSRVNLLHQDAFQRALLAAREKLPAGAIVNLVSNPKTCPLMRELWDLWMDRVFRPERRYYYEAADDLPVSTMPRRQRALMALASVNIEIAAHDWRFETRGMARLGLGTSFPDATLDSVATCQDLFVSSSDKLQAYLRKFSRSHAAATAAAGAMSCAEISMASLGSATTP